MLTTWAWALLIAAAVFVAAGALNFAQRQTYVPPPTDGVEWAQNSEGNRIEARSVAPNTAASRAGLFGVLPGDKLIAISLDEVHEEPIVSIADVQIYLEEAMKQGGHIRYLIERPSGAAEPRYYHVYLDNLTRLPTRTKRDYYINFIGIVYLLVGFFVLFKQGDRAPFVRHFAVLCLAAFVFHFYKPVGSYEDLDQSIAFLDDAALILFAPLFLHFCAIYPARRRLFEKRRWPAALLYAPAALLVGLSALVYYAREIELLTGLRPDFSEGFLAALYRADFAHLSAALLTGAGVLIWRLWTSPVAIVRQQLKWVVWGSVLAIMPFSLLYGVGYLFGDSSAATDATGATLDRWLSNASLLLLILIPLTFGNSVVRYRLMDVDIVVRRAAVYALTTLTVALLIGAVVFGVVLYGAGLYSFSAADGGGGGLTPGFDTLRVIVAVVAMAAIVMSAAPLKNFLQERIDRLFYGERYDLRNGLLDFGRTLSANTALDPLLDALVSRLQQVLDVERVAIFIEDARAASGYRVARAAGLSGELIVPADFREMIRSRSAEQGIVRADDLDLALETSGFVRRALHYYVPCVVRGRMVAVIGLGRSTGGALLSSEDLQILRTVSGYVAVAIENSLLYQEQRTRAAELEMLKEFNESIIESINVGLLAVDPAGRVTGCNSSLEQLMGVTRGSIINRRVEELFAEDFAETLQQVLGAAGWQLTELRNIYKLHTATRAGRSLILNIALAPLRSAEHTAQAGALVVLEDVTARVRLEEQLQQREKLSSIGLLAAGVAHEINTPLTGVSSYTQMLLGMLADGDPKHTLLQKIHRQTERATGIVNNLLNFSRTGNLTDFNELNVNSVLDLTLQLLEPQLRHSQIEIVRDYTPALPKVFANSGKLQQVFTNLILNARDAIVDGGRITLSTSVNDADDSVIIQVTDTGIGIAPENVARIYDPFFTTKGVGRGTGLGLAVSYGIVQEHAGHISVTSQPGQGTTFRITLPTAQGRARLQVASD
ncbi:MAG: PAS domain S-box protein [Pyrinomonadaceae bacterium]|nr:PAS domain S-box protein [Pyrinomonadaceae bacterium]